MRQKQLSLFIIIFLQLGVFGSFIVAIAQESSSSTKASPVLASNQNSAIAKQEQDTEEEKSDLEIKLRIVSDTKWRMTLTSEKQVKAIHFFNDYPNLDWKVESSEFEFKTTEDALVIQRIDHQPFDQVVCEVVPKFRETIRDYEPLWEFSDGAVMIYTGQFPWEITSTSDEVEEINRSFVFATDRKECIILDGAVKKTKLATHEVKWTPGDRDSYIYFGNGIIEETDVYIGLIDPELPGWIKDRLKSFMPKLVSYYTQRIGVPLPNRPMLMFSFNDADKYKGHTSFTGGTLPGLVQLNVSGSGWLRFDKDNDQHACTFLAHETAHLWNSRLISPARKSRPWIHEGSAEMMAFNALLHLGVVDRFEYLKKFQDAVDRFIENSKDISLNDSAKHGKSKNFYDGGIVVGLMIQKAVQETDPKGDFLNFWKHFTDKTLETGERYSHEDFINAVSEFTANESAKKWVLEFPAQELKDPAATVGALFEELKLGKWDGDRVLLNLIGSKN